MKRVILLFVFTTLLSSGIEASDAVDTAKINVRALLEKQIAEAREKLGNYSKTEVNSSISEPNIQSFKSTEKSEPQYHWQTDDVKEAELNANDDFFENTKKNIWTKLTRLSPFKRSLLPYFFMIEGVLLGIILALLLLSRRSKTNKTKKRNNSLKSNIGKMRLEKLIIGSDEKVSRIRKGLNSLAIRIDDGGREIIKFAKEKGISKGEIFLALKVKGLSRKYK